MDNKKRLFWAAVGFFSALFVFSFIMIFSDNTEVITGYATSDSTTSEVTISQYFAISLSGNLSNGIDFGTQNSTVATNVNASQNYNGTQNTSYFVTLSSDSNTNVNLSISAIGPLNTSGGDEILLGNETYDYNITNNLFEEPSLGSETALTTSPVGVSSPVTPGDSVYYRFWLDIPAGVATGTYNNTINFDASSI